MTLISCSMPSVVRQQSFPAHAQARRVVSGVRRRTRPRRDREVGRHDHRGCPADPAWQEAVAVMFGNGDRRADYLTVNSTGAVSAYRNGC